MKFLALFLLLLGSQAHASGCFPWDVQLVSETSVANLGDFEVTSSCDQNFCGLTIYNAVKNEWHSLLLLNEKGLPQAQISLGNLQVKIFDQYFVSSCTEIHRYVLGIDIKDKRYREAIDLEEL